MESRDSSELTVRDYDVHSSASIAEVKTHVLKNADTFAVFDNHGDITPVGNGEQGLFHDGTRFLSRCELWLSGRRPVLLNSTVCRDNTMLMADLTNPDMAAPDGRRIQHGQLHFFRSGLLWDGVLYHHLRIRNYGQEAIELSFCIRLDADFADIFEIRGAGRDRHGEILDEEMDGDGLTFSYRGLDGELRRTPVRFDPAPDRIESDAARFTLTLDPHEHRDFYLTAACVDPTASSNGQTAITGHDEATDQLVRARRALREESCVIETSNEQFNAWASRSLDDLNLLLTEVPEGHYPYAGIPWYNTFFGRDGLLTALMTLMVNPNIARGVLAYLAQTQATEEDPERVAEPGKILHEARGGEMANLGEVPFSQYYGTVDATPLFVVLAGEYLKHAGDLDFVRGIWPNVRAALEWIDRYGDVDGDGFVEYRYHEGGLTQQGWKDSEDSIFYEDGEIARDPIALVEVQAYVYAARMAAAEMADRLGEPDFAAAQRDAAETLRERFDRAFWDDELGTYILALDGEKRPCRVRTTNAGHVLFCGIATPERAEAVARAMFARDSFAGWGIRTLSEKEQRYNPMSYHNGSVWPHDNAIVALGLGHHDLKDEVHVLMKCFLDASVYDPLRRLPELFCGFGRQDGVGPTPYPVACAPQAWAAAVIFALLQASLGLTIDAAKRCVRSTRPALPEWLDRVTIRNLRVGDGSIDLSFLRYAEGVSVEVLRRDAGIQLTLIK
jgi:glycogen debranching enzyme